MLEKTPPTSTSTLIFSWGLLPPLQLNTNIDKLSKRFKDAYPEYRGHKVYGAVAAIRVEDQCKKFAIRRRLIVIEANPLEVKILNRRGFKLTDFGDYQTVS